MLQVNCRIRSVAWRGGGLGHSSDQLSLLKRPVKTVQLHLVMFTNFIIFFPLILLEINYTSLRE